MKINSQGLQSEHIFHDFAGELTDHGGYISVTTPANLSYYFGNFLTFPNPPKVGDFAIWMALFRRRFADTPEVRHSCFMWEPTRVADKAALKEFTDAGFTVDTTSVLSATSVRAVKPKPDGVEFRQIITDAEWLGVIDAQTEQGFPSIPPAAYRRYKEDSFAGLRRMSEQGLGAWWGAFKGDEMVADMGLYFGKNVGRFQSVETSPAHQRQGICSALVYHVSEWGFAQHPGISLILHAEAGEVAREIYRSVGYEEIEVLESVFKPPPAVQ